MKTRGLTQGGNRGIEVCFSQLAILPEKSEWVFIRMDAGFPPVAPSG